MNWQSLWFVLAGLILGFTISTLWEWFYFRRKRLTSHDRRPAESERASLDYQKQDAQPDAPAYRSTGALLESEEAEELADLATPPDEAQAPVPGTLTPPEEESPISQEATVSAVSSLAAEIPTVADATDLMEEETNATGSDALTAGTFEDDLPTGIDDEAATTDDEPDDGESNKPVAAVVAGGAAGAVLAATVAGADEVSVDRAETTEANEGATAEDEDTVDEDAVAMDEPGDGKTAGPVAPSVAKGIVGPALEVASTDVAEESVEATDSAVAEGDDSADDGASVQSGTPDQQDVDATPSATDDTADRSPQTVAETEPDDPTTVTNRATDDEEAPPRATLPPEQERLDVAGEMLLANIERPDDLCRIEGIGPARRRAFYNAGIFTWYQLGQLTPEEVRDVVNVGAAEAWPARARELAERYGREGAEYSGPAPDNLTEVRGIGQATMELLYRHGIWRFEQLAALSPEQLEEIVPAVAGGAADDRQQWLASARELADEAEEG